MIIRTWKPDICDCKFQISKDFDLEKVIKKCVMHQGLKDKACFTKVVQNDKDINLMPKETDETDEAYQSRRWRAKEEVIKINKKINTVK